jgi:uncharacterized delta-60 repeat protein
MRRAMILACMPMLLGVSVAAAHPGDMDPSFSRNGYIRVGFGIGKAHVRDLAVDAAGRTVAVATVGPRRRPRVAIARLTPDGRLDDTFAGRGYAILPFSPGEASVGGVAPAADGRIVVAGTLGDDALVARLTADGLLDPSFSGDGVLALDFGLADSAADVALAPSGAPLIAGSSCSDGGCAFAVARLGPDGAPDPSFSGDGMATTAFPNVTRARASVIAIAGDGTIVVGGTAESGVSAIAVYEPDGSLRAGFYDEGLVTISSFTGGVTGAAIDTQGRYVFAGRSGRLFRLRGDGNLDPTFAEDGLSDSVGPANAMALGADDRMFVAGRVGPGRWIYYQDATVASVLPDGSRDATFGTRGTVQRDWGDRAEQLDAIALQPDGRIVVGGYSDERGVIARLEVLPGKHDADGDRVSDRRDECILRFSRGGDGCPRFKRSITFKHARKADLWTGRVRSREEWCWEYKGVAIERLRPGPDKRVATARSDEHGRYKADASLQPGRYHARLEREFKGRVGYCSMAVSREVAIR